MRKESAVEALGQQSLLMPARIKAALAANDRLKLSLTMLQAAAAHASDREAPVADWAPDMRQAGLHDATWLRELVSTAYFDDHTLVLPKIAPLADLLQTDLTLMARPVCDGGTPADAELQQRRDNWLARLGTLAEREGLDGDGLRALTHGDRRGGDSLHLLVMDLHRRLNALSAQIATENIDGAHAWQIKPDDRPLIQAFMRGIARTAQLKFSHPGLDTAVTRDHSRLLIQNDIGTNDVHVLVIEVEPGRIALTYSDLHAGRFDFFCRMLADIGFAWTVSAPRVSSNLNAGKPYQLGRAELRTRGTRALCDALERLASRIVFVIDWNRARRRLQIFVDKAGARDLLWQAAREEWGHMAWLLAGGEELVYGAMRAAGADAFRVGDRLDAVLGRDAARDYLAALLRTSSHALLAHQPVNQVADEARLLLARLLARRTIELDLIAEHAAWCHALAQALGDALDGAGDAAALSTRAKDWERRADRLLTEARQRAERQARWAAVVALLSQADDVADALEECLFIHSMLEAPPVDGVPVEVRDALRLLCDTTTAAIQDWVRAIEIARHVGGAGNAREDESFLQTLWRMLRAERLCDEQARQARRAIVRTLHASPAAFSLASDLAATLEKASDALLAAGYSLRSLVFSRNGDAA
ncbi:hypothetical protein [Methyloversatilis sp.]|uniref:hypothetical protein n=1 Tax=Methyloversatilis sp. TaxID=2569862 RepID=UPI002735B371|nr:hypothetical protein [Methyloversatilis sp.]MDP2870005.1 hypothetical protein [Methyloversatilis sp.]MDP3455401.1 hypothetical protein [Methyloversatilis sp.]MDP3578532.1 hypothetical protein [Methyloversatilis sp.]